MRILSCLSVPVSAALALMLVFSACGTDAQDRANAPASTRPAQQEEEPTMVLHLTSSAFREGEPIPVRYTCAGEDISPELHWSGTPTGTASFALIMDDPDAPRRTWDHWVVYNLPADTIALPEAIEADIDLPGNAIHGTNSWRRRDYGGPCPPSGTHRYFFKLFALDTILDLGPGAAKADLLDAMAGHVLAEAQLMGTFQQ